MNYDIKTTTTPIRIIITLPLNGYLYISLSLLRAYISYVIISFYVAGWHYVYSTAITINGLFGSVSSASYIDNTAMVSIDPFGCIWINFVTFIWTHIWATSAVETTRDTTSVWYLAKFIVTHTHIYIHSTILHTNHRCLKATRTIYGTDRFFSSSSFLPLIFLFSFESCVHDYDNQSLIFCVVYSAK